MFLRVIDDAVDGAKEKYAARNRDLCMKPIVKKLNGIRNLSERHQILFSDNRSTLRYATDSSIIDDRELMVRK
jgi:hypothetical protein